MLQSPSALPEMLALILLLFLLAFSVNDNFYASRRSGLFFACILATIHSSVFHLILLAYQDMFVTNHETLHILGMLSQLSTPVASSLTFSYSLAEIYAVSSRQRGFQVARIALWAVFTAYFMLCLTNHWHHLLFDMDDSGDIMPGPCAWITPSAFALQFVIILICYFAHRHEAEHGFHQVVRFVPFLALSMIVLQRLTEPLYLNNVILAFILLLLLVCCQRQRVHFDRLTGLGSREALATMIHRMIAARQPFTLQQVSLLQFRKVNRRFGLLAGDALLKEVAAAIRDAFPDDRCFRFNGTDFIVFHHHLPTEEADAQLRSIRDRFHQPWKANGFQIHLGSSFAQVNYPQGGETAAELINNLEYCQRRARTLPDHAIVVYDESVRKMLADRETINELITTSLQQTNRFFLCYQPIYDARSINPCAAEALLRMRDDEGKIISPGVFIPAAEENGSIIQVTWLVLGKVLAFISSHQDENLPPISINFSAQQFAEQDMCSVIRRYLDHYHVSPSQIKIEITERVFTNVNDLLIKNIQGLQEMGVGLYLDDFGTGYSNLASVLNYPIEVVKVDKSLLAEDENSRAQDLLQALVSGLKQLDVQVLIEGVETSEQSLRMQDIGVDRIQGFYYARPMEEKDFLSHMAKNRIA